MCASLTVRREKIAQSFFSIKDRIQEGICDSTTQFACTNSRLRRARYFEGKTAESGRNRTHLNTEELIAALPNLYPTFKKSERKSKLNVLEVFMQGHEMSLSSILFESKLTFIVLVPSIHNICKDQMY